MKRSLASVIGRTLLAASDQAPPPRALWSSSLEQALHGLGCRSSLTPAIVARVIDHYLFNHPTLAFGFFNWASQQPGFAHTSASYQSLLKSLSISRQYSSIDKLLKHVRARKIALHPSVYRCIISSLVAGRRAQMAFVAFSEIGPAVRDVGPEVCNSLLAALSADGNLDSAEKVFDEMLRRGIRLSALGFGVFLWRACGKKGLDEILSLLDDFKKFDSTGFHGSIVALLVVHGLCMASLVKEAVCALEEMRNRDCKPDFMAYRIVAEALREMGDVVGVEIVLKKKRKLGVAPRMNDYREFVLQLVSERLICEAKALGEVIVDGNFPMEDDVLNVLIGSVSATDPLCALSFLRFMIERDRLPTLLTLINLSENLCKHEKGDELVEVFRLLSAKEFFRDLESYNVMVSFLCKGRMVKEGYQVLQEMKKKGLSPDISTYNSLLEACCNEDLVRPAKRLWDEMFACGCCGNLETYNILIKKFSQVGQVEDACHLFRHMFGRGLKPDELTFKFLLQGLCEAKDLKTGLEIFRMAVECDGMLANKLLPVFILLLCKEGFLHSATKLLREHTSGIECWESHLTLLKYLAEMKELPLATEHLQWIADRSPVLLCAIETELAASLSSSLKPEPIFWLSREVARLPTASIRHASLAPVDLRQ